jgi:hypothetical protein
MIGDLRFTPRVKALNGVNARTVVAVAEHGAPCPKMRSWRRRANCAGDGEPDHHAEDSAQWGYLPCRSSYVDPAVMPILLVVGLVEGAAVRVRSA